MQGCSPQRMKWSVEEPSDSVWAPPRQLFRFYSCTQTHLAAVLHQIMRRVTTNLSFCVCGHVRVSGRGCASTHNLDQRNITKRSSLLGCFLLSRSVLRYSSSQFHALEKWCDNEPSNSPFTSITECSNIESARKTR